MKLKRKTKFWLVVSAILGLIVGLLVLWGVRGIQRWRWHHAGPIENHPVRIWDVNFAKEFNDLNEAQLAVAQAVGVPPVEDRAAAEHMTKRLVEIVDNDLYCVDELTHSIPFLVPSAAELLDRIGRNFQDSLAAKGLNPNKLYAGRKIKLPGKIELKDADATNVAAKPAAAGKSATRTCKVAPAAKASARASSYKGETKEYKVKNGDFLGKIAAEHGITVKCLKEMNGLQNNNIRVGQKLKVPAEKPVAEVKPAAPAKPVAAKAAEQPEAPKSEAPAAAPAEAPAAPEEPVAATPAEKPAEAVPAVEQVKDTSAALEAVEAKTHTVKENEDVVSIAIQYGVSPSAIMDLNDLKNGEGLTPGRVLKLPANAKVQ